MIIGLDLDDVLTNFETDLVNRYNTRYNTNYLPGDFTPHPSYWQLHLSPEKIQQIWEIIKTPGFNESLEPVLDATSSIKKLHSKGLIMDIISHRPPILLGSTNIWINTYLPGLIRNIYCTGSPSGSPENGNAVSKAITCTQIGVDLFVDDTAKNVEEVSAAGIHTLLFDYPWNKNCQENGYIKRVHNWQEITRPLL